MKFYMPNKTEITPDEFVKIYSEDYFLKCSNGKGLIPGLNRNSKFIENEIITILRDGIKDGEDGERHVARILAWKIGKIRHRDSEQIQSFVYHRDWQNAEQLCAKIRGKYPIDKAVSYIVENKQELKKRALNNPQSFLNIFEYEDMFKGIGSVYITTLMYFLTQGTVHPIYDRFAMVALEAILSNTPPEEEEKGLVKVKYKKLPDKKTKGFSTIMSYEMEYYIDMLQRVFGNSWSTDRSYDQALWAYGHLFEPV